MKKIFSILLLIAILSLSLSSCGFTTPRPEIKTGEFNFCITYELCGETKTICGVYVCEYKGTGWALDSGYDRDWDGYIKGGEMDTIIDIGTADDGGEIKLNLAFYPDYFMGDSSYRGAPEPWLSVSHSDGEGFYIENEPDVIAERYGARIVSYEYDPPIQNSFGLFK